MAVFHGERGGGAVCTAGFAVGVAVISWYADIRMTFFNLVVCYAPMLTVLAGLIAHEWLFCTIEAGTSPSWDVF
jgi:hypothetical protein